jgi:hypothetical protein
MESVVRSDFMSNGKLHAIGVRETTAYRKGNLYLLCLAAVTVIIIAAIAYAVR